MTKIDLTDDLYYPPLPGIPPLPVSKVHRIIEQFRRDRELRPPADAAQVRFWFKDDEGRSYATEWKNP